MHICIHTYMYTYMYTYIYVYMHACIHTMVSSMFCEKWRIHCLSFHCRYMYTCMCTFACICTYNGVKYVWQKLFVYIIHVYMNTCAYIYINIYIYIYTHTHTFTHSLHYTTLSGNKCRRGGSS